MDKRGLREELLAASKALVLLQASWTAERQGGWTGEGRCPGCLVWPLVPPPWGFQGPDLQGCRDPGEDRLCVATERSDLRTHGGTRGAGLELRGAAGHARRATCWVSPGSSTGSTG